MRNSSNYLDVVEAWKKKDIVTREDLDQALSNFRIVFAYNSGRIENPEITYHNTREVFENGKIVNFTGDVRTIFELQNQKECYDFLAERIIEKENITQDFIKKVHLLLMNGAYDERRWSKGERPGEYKKHDYVTGPTEQGALPEEVAVEMQELCEELEGIPDRGDNIIKTAAYLHCKFENIHPFADGNGRTGRTLMNYYLMTHNHPPLVIYNETKERYYKALDYYDRTGEIRPFVDYMKDCVEQTWGIRTHRQERIESIDLDLEK